MHAARGRPDTSDANEPITASHRVCRALTSPVEGTVDDGGGVFLALRLLDGACPLGECRSTPKTVFRAQIQSRVGMAIRLPSISIRDVAMSGLKWCDEICIATCWICRSHAVGPHAACDGGSDGKRFARHCGRTARDLCGEDLTPRRIDSYFACECKHL